MCLKKKKIDSVKVLRYIFFKELNETFDNFLQENCNGCRIDHPSQHQQALFDVG